MTMTTITGSLTTAQHAVLTQVSQGAFSLVFNPAGQLAWNGPADADPGVVVALSELLQRGWIEVQPSAPGELRLPVVPSLRGVRALEEA